MISGDFLCACFIIQVCLVSTEGSCGVSTYQRPQLGELRFLHGHQPFGSTIHTGENVTQA